MICGRSRPAPWAGVLLDSIAPRRFKSMGSETTHGSNHLPVLDGWRGISILLVLAAHLLPLGPKSWRLNETAGPMGMALFFTLSGFLITRFLIARPNVPDFLIRRLFRIVPIAWLGMLIALWMAAAPASSWLPHFAFYANLPPIRLTDPGAHLWSLCVEMQFYVGIALLVAALGVRGLYLLPVLCIAVTINRLLNGAHVEIVTWLRVDEILAGCLVAMATASSFGPRPLKVLGWLSPYPLMVLLAVSSHPDSGGMSYLRPYFAALLVGSTLSQAPARLASVLSSRVLAYVAAISYALYVIHHLLIFTWLGSGDRLEKYLKRPLLIATTFALAHASTFHVESRCIAAGKRLAAWLATWRAQRQMN
jgi:peptidoglycan/LPS O-acetylase OafA/YrhL